MEDQDRIGYEADIKSLVEHNRYLACKKQKTIKVVKLISLSPVVIVFLLFSFVALILFEGLGGVMKGIDSFVEEFKKFL